jgi:hypothetical protein
MRNEKKTMTVLAAKAVARVKGNPAFPGSWGVGEHLAALRFMAVDALADAANKPEVKAGKEKIGDAFNGILKTAFAADPELAYASNFQKLLVKTGELKDLAPSYE